MCKLITIVASLLFIASCVQPQRPGHTAVMHYYTAATTKPYDDVLAELEIAIAEHNFRITGHSRVGEVIRKRGAENFPEFDTIQFCNLTHARKMLEINPHAISYMPCNVVIYQHEGKVLLKTHLLSEDTDREEFNRFARKINGKLKEIVDFAAEE